MVDRIYLASPHMSEEGYELEYVKEAFASNWIAPMGYNVDAFEKEFARITGCRACAALSTGTAAMHMALKAAGIKEGDIVFCQSLTFSASVNPVIYEKAIPVFIDSDDSSWNMDPKLLEKAFLKYQALGRLPKAVIVVHLYGLSADLDPILSLCERFGAVLIEDAAESLGTLYKGQSTGTLGEYGIYSFNGNKIITTSGGGMLVARNEERVGKVRFWSTQAREPVRHYEHKELGYNYRMSNILAGIGRGQLKVLPKRLLQKKHIFEFYRREIGGLKGISMMPVNEWNQPNYWLSCIRITDVRKPIELIHALEEENIEARPVWKPMHLQPYYRSYDFIGNNTAEKIFLEGVCLPSDTKMTEEQLERIVKIIQSLWR